MANTTDTTSTLHYSMTRQSAFVSEGECAHGAGDRAESRAGAWWLLPAILCGAGLWFVAARAVVGLFA